MPTPIVAANAYAALAKLTESAGKMAKPQAADSSGQSFGALLKDALGGIVEAGRKSDVQSQAMAAGKANVVDVVTAVAETEVAISALVSVRDRVIQSYEEIMRMPI